MKNLLQILIAAAVLSACALGVDGNGQVKEQNRPVGTFDGIEVEGSFRVHLSMAPEHGLRVVTDENLQPLIQTNTEKGILRIFQKEQIGTYSKMDIYISAPDFESVESSGAITLDNQGTLKGDNLEIEASGAAEMHLRLDYDNLNMEFSGGCEVVMEGSADEVEIDLSGAGDLDLSDLEVNDLELSTSGAADVIVNVKGNLSVDASGAADIRYIGEPTIRRSDLSGAATLKPN